MQDQWYGDKRDLVKWGTLLELARKYQVTQILQVLYHCSNTWNPIEIDGQSVRIPDEVIQHFRDTKSICNLNSSVPVQVLGETFSDRERYLRYVVGEIQGRKGIKKIVFLDPDTGLQPRGGHPNWKHVLEGELETIWNSLSDKDVLVFYQHQPHIPDWINTKKRQFAEVIRIPDAKCAYAPLIAPDVVFFFAQRAIENESIRQYGPGFLVPSPLAPSPSFEERFMAKKVVPACP